MGWYFLSLQVEKKELKKIMQEVDAGYNSYLEEITHILMTMNIDCRDTFQ